jgi:SSS family solute:Na+ symporter
MSTASACLLASSTVLLEDVYLPLRRIKGKGSVGQSRAVTLALGVAMTLMACVMHDVIAAITVAYDLLVGGLLVPILGAMLWKRGTAPAALASIGFGSALVIVTLAVRGLNSDLPIYAGLAGGFAAYVLVSLGSRRREIEPVTGANLP